jgi:hypothetical protein
VSSLRWNGMEGISILGRYDVEMAAMVHPRESARNVAWWLSKETRPMVLWVM